MTGGSLSLDGHPMVATANFTDISGGSYAARLGSTGSSTIRSTQIYGGGSHIATFDGVNIRLGIGTTTPSTKLECNGTVTATQFKYASHPGHTALTGNNSTTAFTILAGHNVNSILVVYNGLILTPTTDYTISGTTMTMQFTPPTNAQIIVRYLPN